MSEKAEEIAKNWGILHHESGEVNGDVIGALDDALNINTGTMKSTQEHIYLYEKNIHCNHCGGLEEICYPIELGKLKILIEKFKSIHELCEPIYMWSLKDEKETKL